MEPSLMTVGVALFAVLVFFALVMPIALRGVDAGQILLARRGSKLRVFRGPCKALIMPIFTQLRVIPAQSLCVPMEVTDQTSDVDAGGNPAPVKVTVQASALVDIGDSDASVNTAANKFFVKPSAEQILTLRDVLAAAVRRAINRLKHDQLFDARAPGSSKPSGAESELATQASDAELSVLVKGACARELSELGLAFGSLSVKAVLSEVSDARCRESAARAKANADVAQAREEQRARIAELESAQLINDQERALGLQVAANGAAVARAEAERQAALRQQREAELTATQITQARADADQNLIQQDAEGRAQAARIRAMAQAEAEAIRMKADALLEAGGAYLDLRRLEMAPELTRQVAAALANGKFVNFGTPGAFGEHGAVATGSDDVLRVVQTLMAAQVITGHDNGKGENPLPLQVKASMASEIAAPPTRRRGG